MAATGSEQDLWTAQRKRKNKIILIISLLIPLSALAWLIVRNNLSSEARSSAAPAVRDSVQAASKGMEVFDGKGFRVVKEPGPGADASPKEPKYTFRLSDCMGIPADEKKLVMKMTMDLEFDSPKVLKEIQERQEDLRVLVNLKVSGRKLAEVEVRTLRPALIEATNQLLKSGTVSDIRFVNFRVERLLTDR